MLKYVQADSPHIRCKKIEKNFYYEEASLDLVLCF